MTDFGNYPHRIPEVRHPVQSENLAGCCVPGAADGWRMPESGKTPKSPSNNFFLVYVSVRVTELELTKTIHFFTFFLLASQIKYIFVLGVNY